MFLHELAAWLRSPLDKVGQWDRSVQYRLQDESVVNGLGQVIGWMSRGRVAEGEG